MVRTTILLVIFLFGCSHFASKVVYVNSKPPANIYNCKPTVFPDYVETKNGNETYYVMDNKETEEFQTMIQQIKACLESWRDWSSK